MKLYRYKKKGKALQLMLFFLMFTIIFSSIYRFPNGTHQFYDNNTEITPTSPNDRDVYSLENNGSVFETDNGSKWKPEVGLSFGYDFVSTAAGKNHTYVMTNNGTIWRHHNSTWNQSTWSKLQVASPITSNGWVSIDISKDYIYILHADGDSYRIPKDPGWPNPGNWIQSSNSIPVAIPSPLNGGETSFISITVDWNDTFCFILRNNGEVYRHECDNSPIGGSWTSPGSNWAIYGSYNTGPGPFKLEHGDGSGMYWGIPSTGWVSIDVYDNYLEPTNFSVYVLHSSGLVARHANHPFPPAPFFDWWLNPNSTWELDPRWSADWVLPGGVFQESTAFVSISCNDQDIFILKNDGEVFFIPEADFISMAVAPSWLWFLSPLPLPPESKTSAFVSIDSWTEPFILKNDGKEWRNIPYRSAPNWDSCWDNYQNNGQGTLYPNVFSYSSIAAYNTSTLFVLSKNGSIYNSTDKGQTWQKFGDLGYGNDSAWVSIAAANHKNHSYLYALYNNGTVVRTIVKSFQPQTWGNCNNPWPFDTSWVSISCDGNATVYTLRNLGYVSYKFQGGSWQSKGTVIGDKPHQDSSWVCIEAHHGKNNSILFTLRNDRALDTSFIGSTNIWVNAVLSSPITSHVAHTFNNKWIWVIRNMGEVIRSPTQIISFNILTIISGDTGFVDICYPIDNFPWDDNPSDRIVSNIGFDTISWHLYDDIGLSHYRIIINGSKQNWSVISVNGSLISYPISKSKSGFFNYTILYNDSVNQFSSDTVIVKVDFYPWNDKVSNITTDYNDSYTVNWTLYDDYGGANYRVLVDGIPSNWTMWINCTKVQYPINRSSLGLFNYTIEYYDNQAKMNTSTIFIRVQDPYNPWSNTPSNLVTFTNGTETINWTLYDGFDSGFYRVFVNNTPLSWNPWLNATNLQVPIDRSSSLGVFNYTIQFNDSAGNYGKSNTVWVTVKDITSPTSNNPSNFTTTTNGPETINWTLWDEFASGSYQIFRNGKIQESSTWINDSNLAISVNRTELGEFNYTIHFNDSAGNYGTDTVWITVEDVVSPWVSNPGNILTGKNGTETIGWVLFDNFAGGFYRVLVNNTPSDWKPWTVGTNLNYPINRTVQGVFNYTTIYNDSGNNWGSPGTIFVTVDLYAPSASNPSPLNYTNDSTPSITVDLDDSLSGVNSSSITMKLNGTEVNHTWDGSTVSYNLTTPHSDGDLIIVKVNASDMAGNLMINYNWSFIIDLNSPCITVSNPGNQSTTTNSSTSIKVILMDSLSDVDEDSIEMNVNGTIYNITSIELEYNSTTDLLKFTPGSNYNDGNISVYIDAKDKAGNIMGTYYFMFTIDSNSPYAINPSPINQSYTNNNQTQINISIYDEISGVDFNTLNMWVNSTLYVFGDVEISIISNRVVFTPSTPFNEGYLYVVVNISDNAGNLMPNYSWYFIIDVQAPRASNPNPGNLSYETIFNPNITIQLTDNFEVNESQIVLNVEGKNYSITDVELSYNNNIDVLRFVPSDNFTEGQVIDVELISIDVAGNYMSKYYFSFTIDTLIPQVNILSPQIKTYATSKIWLNLTCNDVNLNSTWYRIYNVSDSLWNTPRNITWNNDILLHFTDQKTYRLYAWVNDSAGNEQKINVSVEFSVDFSVPSITIISPLNQTYRNVNLNLVVDNSSSTTPIDRIWFRYSNNSFTRNFSLYYNGSYWLNESVLWSEGSVHLQVFANSTTGRITLNEKWFTIDLTAPTINITDPIDGAILSKSVQFELVDVGSNDSDIVQIILQYNYKNAWNTYKVWISGSNLTLPVDNQLFELDTTALPDSDSYIFRFIAIDRAPNDGYAYLGLNQNLTIDNTPPELVEIISISDDDGVPVPGYYNGILSIQYNANDIISGISSQVELFNQSGTWILNSSTNPIQWSTGTSDDGYYEFILKVYDLAGNSNTSSIYAAIIDNTAPDIPVIDNITDSYGHDLSFGIFNGTITFNFTASDATSGIIQAQLWYNSTLVANTSASSIVIDSELLLDDGLHNFHLVVVDMCLNSRSSFLSPITAKIDNSMPNWSNKVSNLLFEVENTTQELFWEAEDKFPANYTIYNQMDGIIQNGTWNTGSVITYSLGSLPLGNRSYRIVLRDEIGYYIEDEVWVCVQNNSIKANKPKTLNYNNIFNGLNIIITSNKPGNLSVVKGSNPSAGVLPEDFLLASTMFVNITFITDYSGSLNLTIEIEIFLNADYINNNNIDPESIRIAHWEERDSRWKLLETSFNSELYSVNASINGLSYFAIFGKPVSGPDNFLWFIIIIAIVVGAIATVATIFLIRRRSKETSDVTPRKKGKRVDSEKLILERDGLIDKAEQALNEGDIKRAIRLFEKIGKISRELGEFELYNQCVEKVKELRTSLLKEIGKRPAEAPPGEVPIPIEEEKEVKILRGGEVVGDKIIYKVKVQNNSKFNITDVTVFLISYPRECMGLTTKETRSTPKVESGGYRSLEFEFEPHKDCVEGTVHASVTYIDHLNQSHTESVQPFTIRSVCDLLKPYRVDEEEFDNMVLEWQKTGEFNKINLNIYNLFEKSKITLERHNFSIVSSKLYETEDSVLVRGLIKAFAEGKYGKKKIGMLVEMMGNKDGELSQIRTSSTSEDEGMMASPISEVIEDFTESGLSLKDMSQKEKEEFIKEKSLQSLRYLLILHKQVGITIYSVNFSDQELDPDLVSGFLSAISSFGMELSGGQSIGIRKMEYESLKIVLQQGNYVNVGLILDDFPEDWLDLRLKTFVRALENQYKQYLENWTGDVRPFKTIGKLFAKIFEIKEDE
ncbi:MAG: hypothetical protein GF329_07395 [Candidatus Lokiarchaeota archaeon]|nr:hypothetical protein [Candidatus Lokiarchaeota archaeon]